MEEKYIDVCISWSGLAVPLYNVASYSISSRTIGSWIKCAALSDILPDTVYLVNYYNWFYSFNIATLRLVRLSVVGVGRCQLYQRNFHHMFCHGDTLVLISKSLVYKFQLVATVMYLVAVETWGCVHDATFDEGTLCLVSSSGNHVIDVVTMERIFTVHCSDRLDMFVVLEQERELHIATRSGVKIFTYDTSRIHTLAHITTAVYTGVSYLDDDACGKMAFSRYHVVVQLSDSSLVILRNDLSVVCHVAVPNIKWFTVNDSNLAVVSQGGRYWHSYFRCITVFPFETFHPPFSLYSLCQSAIMKYRDTLPISLLPLPLYKLLKHKGYPKNKA